MIPRLFSKTSPALAGLRLALGAASVAYIAVAGAQWAFGQLLKRSCVEKLESLESASQTFLTAIAAALSHGKDSDLGWPAALRAAWETSPLPPGFAVGLLEINSDSGALIEARLLQRFSAERMPGLDRLEQPLTLPGLISLLLQSMEGETVSLGDDVTRRFPFENPWNRDRLWPLKMICVSPCMKGNEGFRSTRFVVLFCQPGAIQFGGRWATAENMLGLVPMGFGAQPLNPSYDSTTFKVHVVRWFGSSRAFVTLDQGLRPAAQYVGIALEDFQRQFVVLLEVFIGGIDLSDRKQNAITLLLL